MTFLTRQEKYLIIVLTSTAFIGSIIGAFRHDWLNNPEILISPNNLPAYINAIQEEEIISKHNSNINNPIITKIIAPVIAKNSISRAVNIVSKNVIQEKPRSSAINNPKSNKKKISQNTLGVININSASKEDFKSLPYIGDVKAERIINYRNEIGVFKSIDDLENVKGIGPKTLAKLKPFITI